MIKNFKNWLSEGYYDPSEDEEYFIQKHENAVIAGEDLLRKSGTNIPKDFWDMISDLDLENDYTEDIQDFTNKNWNKMYDGDYDPTYSEPLVSKEYLRIEKELDSSWKKTPSDYKERRRALENALAINMIEKNLEEFRKIYEKYLKILHDKRGTLSGRKYGL